MLLRNWLIVVSGLIVLSCNSLAAERAAIIISGGGNESSNPLWNTTENINNAIYRTLANSGFNDDEIYYLSPVDWADFNGDGINDQIVDAPKADRAIESADIQKAFDWAKQRGKLDQPLYIFFVGHGNPEKLPLSKDNTLPVEQFQQILDDYQKATNNELVLMIDASFSGILGKKLIADKRAIITSAGNEYAYFNRMLGQGFSSFLAKGLDKEMSFEEAFQYATNEQKKLLDNSDLKVMVIENVNIISTKQTPQKYDQNQIYSLDKLFLYKSFVTDSDTNLQIRLNQINYAAGNSIRATITEHLSQGYDLYLAVILPSGDFLTLKDKNTFSAINVPEYWYGKRQQGVANTFLELPLPALPQGQYCLFAVLSPQDEPPLNSTQYWKQTTQCFSVN